MPPRLGDNEFVSSNISSQRTAARVAGFSLLSIILSGVVGTLVGRDHIIVPGDAAATALNIMSHERLFRVGTACEIVMFNCDVVLAIALYVLLKPVNATLALLGSFWRLANAIMLGVSVVGSIVALDLLSGAHYLATFKTDQLQALAALFLDLYDRGSVIGLIFFSLGAAVHSYLLLRSGYIPRILSLAYLIAVVWLLICCFIFIICPGLAAILDPAFILPDFVAELLVGLWLALKGANIDSPNDKQLDVATA